MQVLKVMRFGAVKSLSRRCVFLHQLSKPHIQIHLKICMGLFGKLTADDQYHIEMEINYDSVFIIQCGHFVLSTSQAHRRAFLLCLFFFLDWLPVE